MAKGRTQPTRKGRACDNPRACAARIIQGVMEGRSLSDVIGPGLEAGAANDRALIQELCYGVLRWHPRLDTLARLLVERPLKAKEGAVQALILLGLYQLLYMRVAPHAAVKETVEAARHLDKPWAAGLLNAVLRRFQREQATLLERLDHDPAARHACPGWLLEALQEAWPDDWETIVAAANQRPPMSLRINLRQGSGSDYAALLAQHGIGARPLPASAAGVVLDQPLDVQALPGFPEGRVSVQDGGAQLAAALLELKPGQHVLDVCAAPGGKTCHILETEPGLASVTAVDESPQRLARVHENLQRLGLEAELCQGDASRPEGAWAERRYERILLDVPCSATGVIRRHPDIKLLRRADDIPSLAALQARILTAIWPLLAPGGMLLYATCSIMPEENEQQIRRFLDEHADACERPIEADWGRARNPGRQVLPGEQTMDGFYYARLEKT